MPTPSPRLDELPPHLRPVARKHGAWWEISYRPDQGKARYVARPRNGGRAIRTDTARLLDRVLSRCTCDEP